MMITLTVLLIGVLLYLIFLMCTAKNIADQLHTIEVERTNSVIKSPTKNRFFVSLVQSINKILLRTKEKETASKEKNQKVDQALNNIAHDLRTPLTIAMGYSQYLNEPTSNSKISQKEVYLSIEKNLELVKQRLDQLLDYNRINERKIQINPEYFNFSELVSDLILNSYSSFAEKGFHMNIDIEPSIDVILDKNQAIRIVQNVIGNILEHGRRYATFKLYLANDDSCIFVAKNGIDEKVLNPERLTERFYTEDFSRQKETSGLGLFIVKQLVSSQNGHLEIDTSESEFCLSVKVPISTTVTRTNNDDTATNHI